VLWFEEEEEQTLIEIEANGRIEGELLEEEATQV
jgi:hypothetical protein